MLMFSSAPNISFLFSSGIKATFFLKNHSRVTASNWIYQNVPSGSVIATEYWDDTLPLSIGNNLSYQYQYQSLHVADIEDENKIEGVEEEEYSEIEPYREKTAGESLWDIRMKLPWSYSMKVMNACIHN